MSDALRTLLAKSVDYAGLFPPARLTLDEAVRNYRRYAGGRESWLLGRFVCPVALLPELRLPGAAVSVIGTTAETRDNSLATLRRDVEAIHAFQRDEGRGRVEALEVKLPRDREATPLGDVLADVQVTMKRLGGPSETYLEVALREGQALQTSNFGGEPGATHRVGLKIRTANDVAPSAERLALFLETCTTAGICWKATAGLHHPFAHDGQHGFLNVFVAAVLAFVHRPPRGVLVDLLRETSPAAFVFAAEHLTWNGLRATLADIEQVRRCSLVAFGSCSFEEPRDHVIRLVPPQEPVP